MRARWAPVSDIVVGSRVVVAAGVVGTVSRHDALDPRIGLGTSRLTVQCDDGRTWAALLNEWHEFVPVDDDGNFHAEFVSAAFVDGSGFDASSLLIKGDG